MFTTCLLSSLHGLLHIIIWKDDVTRVMNNKKKLQFILISLNGNLHALDISSQAYFIHIFGCETVWIFLTESLTDGLSFFRTTFPITLPILQNWPWKRVKSCYAALTSLLNCLLWRTWKRRKSEEQCFKNMLLKVTNVRWDDDLNLYPSPQL